ncbi:hypothetical protein MRB53_040130 [Persea americana]|nr:hypothetical protein MRB53_040130 [Persea americana]
MSTATATRTPAVPTLESLAASTGPDSTAMRSLFQHCKSMTLVVYESQLTALDEQPASLNIRSGDNVDHLLTIVRALNDRLTSQMADFDSITTRLEGATMAIHLTEILLLEPEYQTQRVIELNRECLGTPAQVTARLALINNCLQIRSRAHSNLRFLAEIADTLVKAFTILQEKQLEFKNSNQNARKAQRLEGKMVIMDGILNSRWPMLKIGYERVTQDLKAWSTGTGTETENLSVKLKMLRANGEVRELTYNLEDVENALRIELTG